MTFFRIRRKKILKTLLLIGIAGIFAVVFFYVNLYRTYAGVCLTRDQAQTDSRCLFIYKDRIFEKGTRDAPHQGNQCGTDVTAIIPSFHFMDMAQYLDPNYVGDVCPVASPTPTPTDVPTGSPCPLKSTGDANCDGKVTLVDFQIWRNEFTAATGTTADFNADTRVTLVDFQIWRNTFISH